MDTPRKLAAILTADVAGYSRLTGLDEEGTLKHLRKFRRELINPAVSLHRGRANGAQSRAAGAIAWPLAPR